MNPEFRFVVRVEAAEGWPVGVGCLVAPDLFATCAHVVADALGDRNLCFGDAPEQPIQVSFPFAAKGSRCAASVVGWHPALAPPDLPSDGLGDLAILRVENPPPLDGAWVELSDRLNLAPHEFIAWGYPSDMTVGDFAEGRTVALMPNRWYRLGAERTTGRLVEPGFSGGPVVLRDLGLVGGLIVLHDLNRSLGGGLMISGRVVNQALEAVRETAAETAQRTQAQASHLELSPGLPAGYLPRSGLEAELVEALVSMPSGVVMLTGPLGVGKGVLATAAVEHEAVRAEFRDGIHWLEGTFAQSPLEIQSLLHAQLVEARGVAPGIAAGRQELEDLLRGRRALIVMDGISEAGQLAALPVGCDGPVFLATARRDLRHGDGPSRVIEVGPLDRSEAQSLLMKVVGPYWPAEGPDDPNVTRLLDALGGIPLLLGLAGSQIRESDGDWAAVAAMFEPPEAEPAPGITRDPHRFQSYMDAVVGALSAEDRRRYRMLVVLPSKVGASWEVLQVLWDCADLNEIEVTANRLTRRALAHWTAQGTLALHELQRAFVRSRIADLATVHRALVDGYRRQCNGRWGELEDDGYVHHRLATHMSEAGLRTDLEALHSDFEWLCRRLELGSPAELAGDLERYGPTHAIRVLGRIMRQGSRELTRNPRALPTQVLARLDTSAVVASLRLAAREAVVPPALVPIGPSLASPLTIRSVMRGHDDAVASVSVSADGTRCVSASLDRSLRLWDLKSGVCVAELHGHSDYARSVALSVDGRVAVSGGYDGTLRVWDLDAGECRRVLTGHAGAVKSVAISPDAALAASGGSDGILRVWKLDSGCCLSAHDAGGREIRSVSLTSDGALALAACEDGFVRTVEVATGRVEKVGNGSEGTVRVAALDADGRLVLLGSAEGEVVARDLRSGGDLFRLPAHGGAITSLSVAAERGIALSGSRDGFAKLLDLNNGRTIAVTRPHAGRVLSVALARNGRRMVSGASDGWVRCWDIDMGEVTRQSGGHSLKVNALAISFNGRWVASGSDDRAVLLWDAQSGLSAGRFEGHGGGVTSVAFLDDGVRLASGSLDGTIRLWDLRDRRCLTVMKVSEAGVSALAVAPGSDRLLSGDGRGALALWDMEHAVALARTDAIETGPVRQVALGKAGAVALFAAGRIGTWDVEGPRPTVHRCLGRGYPGTISTDGTRALATDHAGRVMVWNLDEDRCISRVGGPDAHASCLAVVNERLAAVGCHEGCVYLWDVRRGEDCGSFDAGTAVVSVAGTPELVMIGDEAGGVHMLRAV